MASILPPARHQTLTLLRSQSDTGASIIQELQASFFKYGHYSAQRIGSSFDGAVESLHSLHGSDRYFCLA